MRNKSKRILVAGLSALFVASFFLFAALWVNGNFPLPEAIGIAVVLGAGIYAAMASSARKAH